MASLPQLLDAIGKTIQNGTTDRISHYAGPGDVTQLPAVVVEPEDGNFALSMSGDSEYRIRIYVMCSIGTSESSALALLNTFLDGWGPNSVRQVIYGTPAVGLEHTTVFVDGFSGYTGAFTVGGQNAVGAIVAAHAITDSRVQ